MTVKEFLKSIASKIGAVDPDEDLSTNQYNILLRAANALLGEWSAKRMTVITETSETLALDVGVGYKALGGYADKLLQCYIRYQSIDYPVIIETFDEFSEITDKTVTGMPEECYLSRVYPDAKIYFSPVPDYAYSCVTVSLRPLTEITDLNATISIPRSYERALKLNIAVDVASDFHRVVTPDLFDAADRALRSIEAINAGNNESDAKLDAGIPGVVTARYNIWES